MATIEYEKITDAIVKLLQDAIPESRVYPDPEIVGLSSSPEIGVTYEGEENKEEIIGHANPYVVTLDFTLSCVEYSIDGSRHAIRKRHALVNKVRDAVKADPNRNLGGLAEWTQIGGVKAEPTERDKTGFWAVAYMKLLVTIMG
jgi:hypothetical protein